MKFQTLNKNQPLYMSAKTAACVLDCSPRHVQDLMKEIRDQETRYGRYALSDTKVDIFVLIDWNKYRKAIKQGIKVPEFNAAEVARVCPVLVEWIQI